MTDRDFDESKRDSNHPIEQCLCFNQFSEISNYIVLSLFETTLFSFDTIWFNWNLLIMSVFMLIISQVIAITYSAVQSRNAVDTIDDLA